MSCSHMHSNCDMPVELLLIDVPQSQTQKIFLEIALGLVSSYDPSSGLKTIDLSIGNGPAQGIEID